MRTKIVGKKTFIVLTLVEAALMKRTCDGGDVDDNDLPLLNYLCDRIERAQERDLKRNPR